MMNQQKATDYFSRLSQLLLDTQVFDQAGAEINLDEGMQKAVEMIWTSAESGGKVMVMGNGGSAAIASHLHNDLCKAVGVKSLVFNEPPFLTALANDHGYGCVFERPAGMWAEKNDLVIAISSSGRSENILRGVKAATEKGAQGITFSGFKKDNPLRSLGSLNFYIADDAYGPVEIAHSALTHVLTDIAMLKNNNGGQS